MLIMTPLYRYHMVKLQKQVAYKYKGHPIYKYRVNLPSEIVDQLGLREGQELDIHVKGHDVVLCPSKEKSE